MRIVVSLGIKDEVEIIERTIAHLWSIGVDLVIACDMGSTDGTIEALERLRSREDLWLVRMSDEYDQDTWTGKNLDLLQQAKADWVIFLDADEYPLPASGSIRDCAAMASADIVSLDRFNVPLTPVGPAFPDVLTPSTYDDVLLVVNPIEDFWSTRHRDPQVPWITTRIRPRFIAQPRTIRGVTAGVHDVLAVDETSVRRSKAGDLFIAHLPFTTSGRFRRKIQNARQLLVTHDAYFGPHSALHWRRWVAMDERSLDEEFSRQVFDAGTIADLRRRGVVRSATEVFRGPAP